ncbi:discoidin domain-containing receptor tyrosine kinase B [Bacillus rossius redtenbacheri]|uniref:discoidin domain-containing receptor tyrosine kinase B n=1 Tax=Bacillus rossius redtenbacheri TaxID=93214 RepID=UPI002FDC7FF3
MTMTTTKVFLCTLTVLLLHVTCRSLDLESCNSPLGMESGAIPDADVTASSAYDSGIVGPQHGRLRHDKNGGAWCPKHMVTPEAREYLEVDLGSLHAVTATQTQGRFGNGQGKEYAEVYMLDYWRPGAARWLRWKDRGGKEFIPGNTDTYTMVEQKLDPPVLASRLRFVPFSEHMRTVCMRVEIVGCRWPEGLLSYSMPQGVQRGADIDLSDRTYDGREEAGHLSGGLGQLVDGRRGQDNFRLGKGYEWVGWRNDTAGMVGRPVEVLFEFQKVRNFSAMYLHTNNFFSKDVQVFSHAKAYFSIGGHQFSGEPVIFSYMPDVVIEQARNVTIKLHHRVGRFIRLHLYFAAKWIMISELSFDSVPLSGNFSEEEAAEGGQRDQHAGGREYPLQRDEVHTTPSRDDRRGLAASAPGEKGGRGAGAGDQRQHIGLVIGVLTAVILLLSAAILFIVLRNRRLRAAARGVAPGAFVAGEKGVTINMKELQMRVNVSANGEVYGQVSMDDCPASGGGELDKGSLYHEPYHHLNTYSGPAKGDLLRQPASPDYTDVPDIVSQEYEVPHINVSDSPPPPFAAPPVTPARTLPPLSNIFPKPPPVPPPPEKYYAATEICKTAPQLPPPPQLSPPIIMPLVSSVQGVSAVTKFTASGCPDKYVPGVADDGEEPLLSVFPRDQLCVLEKLGNRKFGEVHLCKVGLPNSVDVISSSDSKLVIVKSLRIGSSESTRCEFRTEVQCLARLRDPNVVRVLGVCLQDEPLYMVIEYLEFGDLNQFLQEHIAETASPLPRNVETLSYGCLIYMATQISSGMKYLESLNFVHQDLATRNCLVGKGYTIKVSDIGMGRSMYAGDYCELEGRDVLVPLRWMAWESILLGKFTTKSDVWSFAVTLWEILTFAREQPFEDLSDVKIVENATHFYQDDGQQMFLPIPISCPREIYDLMCECWQRNESDRPNFREIHLFLQRKNLGYKPEMD